ncbi:MAG TPA: acetate--CoA ligase [Gammaproteobacteria bacterium]|jgi:acetyl-CoA synthetase|nr:acetate--CoA ligase [Gammaproteobacteria bacterium]
MSQNKIESILNETRRFEPPERFVSNSQLTIQSLARLKQKALDDYEKFWADLAHQEIQWFTPFTEILDESQAPNYTWFADGKLNASYNCLDVNVNKNPGKIAIIFEGENGDVRTLTYADLLIEVCRLSNGLLSLGVKPLDRVIIYMPMVPEAIIAMQACARIGAVHSVVFGGFSAKAMRDRIEDAEASLVITADGGYRGGKVIPLKESTDKALQENCASVKHVVVLRRTEHKIPMRQDRDIWWHELVDGQNETCEATPVSSEHPLFILYTSGSTGKPKGIQHSTAGYLLGAKLTNKWVFDLAQDDIFWCTADVGWITGHSYVAYGPLAAGTTIMIYEGAPTYPDGGRFWEICQRHKISIFYTAPTAIRALMRLGDALPNKYDLSRLRLLGTVGEPINPEAWMWYHKTIGKEKCPIVDTWWQTETGAIMISPIPGVTTTKPGSCTQPLPGIMMDIVDEEGLPITDPGQGGYLVVTKPWPSMLRTIWGDNQRYLDTYWERFGQQYYVAGDSANRDADGYFWIMGRIDDVLNVSGHRLGTMEVESALVAHPDVAEAAVVGKPHEIKGEGIFAYVVPKGTRPEGKHAEEMTANLRDWVAEQLGPIAKPDEIRFTDNLPKTRSGKIMRRLLRSLAKGEEITQDTSTLEDESILDQLRGDS